ncbi:MAG: Carbon monoxide dehydrogenase [Klenkia sp.]|nr:Carbon monoxide dehydrogenase [Klenkia sp.]
MQLENSFIVPVPIDDAWRVLLDIERIAPCMPGAALDSVTGDDFTGRVKVKLGPINLTYAGKASFIEKDDVAHKAVIDARGKDQRGNGTAAAVVTAVLADEGSSTRVNVLTDLNITGRPAQFGRGVMTDVGNKLLGQFADRLAAQLGTSDEQHALDQAAAAQAQEPTVTKAAAEAAGRVTGAAEEVAASVASVDGDNPVAEATRKVGEASFDAAATASDEVAAAKAPSTPRPVQSEPEPIDLLEVAGGAAFTRFAAPAAAVAVLGVLVALIVRRRR